MFSGGAGSWGAARRVADEHGTDDLVLLFADTHMEDADLYRFISRGGRRRGRELREHRRRPRPVGRVLRRALPRQHAHRPVLTGPQARTDAQVAGGQLRPGRDDVLHRHRLDRAAPLRRRREALGALADRGTPVRGALPREGRPARRAARARGRAAPALRGRLRAQQLRRVLHQEQARRSSSGCCASTRALRLPRAPRAGLPRVHRQGRGDPARSPRRHHSTADADASSASASAWQPEAFDAAEWGGCGCAL
jgi:hypothetical protein